MIEDAGPPYVYRDGKVISKSLAGSRYSPSAAPNVISDSMEPLRHMGTGRVLDSKSQFRRDTAASGCIEVGTDPAAMRGRAAPTPKGVHEDVKRALSELRSR